MVIKALSEHFAPYASANSVIKVIQQYRNHGLPDPLTQTGLEQIGQAPSMASFTLRSLVFLGLMDEGGNFTADFTRIRRANTDEYPGELGEILRKAYLQVFAVTNPAVHDATKIVDAFRPFEPAKQRDKMVGLFMGLCEEAGIVPVGTAKRRKTTTNTSRSRRPAATPDPTQIPESISLPSQTPNGQQEAVELTSGGTMTIILDTNMWQLSRPDEAFLLDILHLIRDYNEAKANLGHSKAPGVSAEAFP